MPNSVRLLLALLSLSAILAGINGEWLGLALDIALIVGVLRGSEFVRKVMLGVAWLNIVVVVGMAVSLGAIGQLHAVDWVLLIGGAALQVVTGLFVVWCLRRWDVQQWMYNRATGA